MKTSRLFTAATSALLAGSASAAAVEMYGAVDTALTWQHKSYAAQTNADTLEMASGQWIGSRVGIKGSEELTSSLKVGFVLENGFADDTGTLSQDGRLFGRDARLYLEGDFGFLSLGRMGSLVGGNGPYARFGHVVSPFSCGWGDIGGHLQVVSLGYEYLDNAVAYKTPTVAGLDATVQYSVGTDSTTFGSGIEGKSSVDRLVSGALRYQTPDLMAAFGIESINWAQPAADAAGLDDAISYNLGANWNAGWAKFYVYGQYFENYQNAAKTTMFGTASGVTGGVDGFGINVGVDIPAFGGTAKVGFGYGDFEGSRASEKTMKTYQTAVGYTYAVSRRTTIYTGANWIKNDLSAEFKTGNAKAVENVYEATLGLVHRF